MFNFLLELIDLYDYLMLIFIIFDNLMILFFIRVTKFNVPLKHIWKQNAYLP